MVGDTDASILGFIFTVPDKDTERRLWAESVIVSGEAEQCEFTVKQVKSNEKVCADIQLFSSVFFMLFCCHQTLNVCLKGTSLTGQGRGPEKKTSFLLLSYFGRKIKGDRERMHRRTVTWNTTHDHIRATQEWQAEIMTKMALEEFKFQAAVNLLLPIGCYDVWPHSIFQITLESKSAWCTIDTEPVRVHPKILIRMQKYVCNVCTRIRCLCSDQSVNNVSAYGAAATEQHMLFMYVILSKMAL